MKLFKKLAAVAAVCITMSVPVSASASTRAVDPDTDISTCPPHYMSVTARYEQANGGGTSHQSVFGYVDSDGDGTYETAVYETCYITAVTIYEDRVCDKCGMLFKAVVVGTRGVHGSCSLKE